MAASSEAVWMNGLATRVQRLAGLGAAPLAGLLDCVRDVLRAAGALICLGRWQHQVPR
jgi:hypothetical protein